MAQTSPVENVQLLGAILYAGGDGIGQDWCQLRPRLRLRVKRSRWGMVVLAAAMLGPRLPITAHTSRHQIAKALPGLLAAIGIGNERYRRT